ncbi:hypothetical protein PIB30_052955 [Stylosanthes scabra]|uniref:Uncharacterized protein n=1 Tax=Stylosanthes scabra TaxID=79078 RepID=A0ABU6QK51_9FABA|nr:hypothetical protein [Stylosanthes scabra]
MSRSCRRCMYAAVKLPPPLRGVVTAFDRRKKKGEPAARGPAGWKHSGMMVVAGLHGDGATANHQNRHQCRRSTPPPPLTLLGVTGACHVTDIVVTACY